MKGLDKRVSFDHLIYCYKGPPADVDEFDNALNLLDKIREGKISSAKAKNDQIEFKSNLEEIKKKETKEIDQKSQKTHCTILKCFTKQGTMLLKIVSTTFLLVFCMSKREDLWNKEK